MHNALFRVNVAEIQPVESEARPVRPRRRSNVSEQNDGLRAVGRLTGKTLRQIGDAADGHLDLTGDCHADHRFAKEVARHAVVRHDNAVRLQEGNPGLEDLPVNQSIVDPNQYDIHCAIGFSRRLSC